MIIVQANNLLTATKQAFFDLYTNGSQNMSDKGIWFEDAAVIEIEDPDADNIKGFMIEQNKFQYLGDYKMYFPEVNLALISAEEEDYTKIFLQSGEIETLVDHFRLYPDSRRQLISSWLPKYMDPKVIGVCITQLYCRLRNNSLVLHSHSRATDAYRLLLLDMQLATTIQREIARQLGVPVGRYIHYIDSLHFYRKYKANIENQLRYMETSPSWKGL